MTEFTQECRWHQDGTYSMVLVPTVWPKITRLPAWLNDEADSFFTNLDFFVIEVVQARRLTPEDRIEAARSYAQRWGNTALRTALEAAREVEPLPRVLARVLLWVGGPVVPEAVAA